ncbi:N-acetyl-gamma-glutamyl-phosphate reductase [Alicyclobacillus fastidiosus]|uniref:N-acetyl-gamma-glutamyl-phosphate reductase n=1 Tax=Alicyclobacillus fastidiosus TaxID=392011 RepID=A0ABV5AH99_9BACL|nr:N-acetyl-gamma-glutamyl-phosphate reductase [Alicyclobacillus fastidiosus]WEH08156.1 N-acetyl-gamma-glutamyl-phosphate reductase [Alicyclobacillus fastidiosus]
MDHNPRVGVIGATGYAGMELVRMLLHHPKLELTYLAGSRERDEDFSELFVHLAHAPGVPVEAFDADSCADRCDLVFVALPSGESGRIAGQLFERGIRVVDLSGDLRLPADAYEAWYGKVPVAAALQSAAVYGLTEFNGAQVAASRLVANPGCYATAALLATKPLESADFVDQSSPLVIDAKSGVTGAGRSVKAHLHFAELDDDFYAYRVGSHQHIPEIEQALGHRFAVVLTTQLLPMSRGIFASVYARLNSVPAFDDIYQRYLDTYRDAPFVHVLKPGQLPHLKAVRGSNYAHIGLSLNESSRMLQVFCAIDNLQKGAAGQALQNANRMFGFSDAEGLSATSMWV